MITVEVIKSGHFKDDGTPAQVGEIIKVSLKAYAAFADKFRTVEPGELNATLISSDGSVSEPTNGGGSPTATSTLPIKKVQELVEAGELLPGEALQAENSAAKPRKTLVEWLENYVSNLSN